MSWLLVVVEPLSTFIEAISTLLEREAGYGGIINMFVLELSQTGYYY